MTSVIYQRAFWDLLVFTQKIIHTNSIEKFFFIAIFLLPQKKNTENYIQIFVKEFFLINFIIKKIR